MNILIFNWKDIHNPEAGGAEVFTHEVSKRWVASGDEVTLFCRAFRGAPSQECIDGVTVVRRGGRLSVYREARRWYAREGIGHFDLVIDEINTRPFMAPSFVRDAPVIAFIHQLAAEVWTEEVTLPLGVIGRWILEPLWLRRYRTVPTITVSASTQSDLHRLGFHNVRVVPEGLSIENFHSTTTKEHRPTVLYVGRLVRTKRPHHAILAYRSLRRLVSDAQLWMVGDGYMRGKLERMAPPGVTFFGRVPEERKYDLMRRAHLLLVPGVREGWGLVVTEANRSSTPAVAYRIPGLRDAVLDGHTGVLVDPTPTSMGAAAATLLKDSQRLGKLQREAMKWAVQFDWDRTASQFADAFGDTRAISGAGIQEASSIEYPQ